MKNHLLCVLLVLGGMVFGQKPNNNQQLNKALNNHFQSHISLDADQPVTHFLVYLENAQTGFIYNKAFGTYSLEHTEAVQKDSPFKIASITKMFTAVVVLQLIEEGKLKFEDRASDLLKKNSYINFEELHKLNGESYGNELTIAQLLRHRTGLADIFTDTEDEFMAYFFENPTRQWTPKMLFDLYYQLNLNKRAHFKPDTDYYYSDTNYFLLGLLIEDITGQSLAENYRSRILKPLQMNNTYFEYYEASLNALKMPNTYVGDIEVSEEVNTSYDWAGGGLVSTTYDLSLFIKGLFQQKLFKKQKTLETMIKDPNGTYGCGLSLITLEGKQFYGHFGFWGSGVLYNPKEELTLIFSMNQANPDFNVKDFIVSALKTIEN